MEINKNIGLTKDDCLKILQSASTDQEIVQDSVSFEIRLLSEIPQGLVGEHFILTIKYKTLSNEAKNKVVFLKNLNATSETIVDMSKSLNAYEKEAFFYNVFLKECMTLGIDISYAPEGYYAKPYLLVMEDISQSGFRTADKLRPFGFGQCRALLGALAKFHMSVVIYEYEKKKINKSYSLATEHSNVVLERVDRNGEINVMERWFQASMKGFLGIIDLLPDDEANTGVNKDEFKNRLKQYLDEFYNDLSPKSGDLCCVLHNDIWCNNIMFQYPPTPTPNDNNTTPNIDGSTTVKLNPIDCKLIDYQVLSYGCPAADVMRAIHATTRQELRNKHEEELLKYYFHRTVECLEKYGISVDSLGNWSWDSFSSTCDRVSLAMKLRAMAGRVMTFLPQNISEWSMQEYGMDGVLFSQRQDCMMKCYAHEEAAEYRTIMNEDLKDLWTMLRKRD